MNTVLNTTESATLKVSDRAHEILNAMETRVLFGIIQSKLGGLHIMEICRIDVDGATFLRNFATELIDRKVSITPIEKEFLVSYLRNWYQFAVGEKLLENPAEYINRLIYIEA